MKGIEEMAKSEIYLNKIEKSRKDAVTGFRLKQAMYNAVRACHAESVSFPYQQLLEKYCIPSGEDCLSDEQYYLLTDNGFVQSVRLPSEREVALRVLADKTGGKVVFSKDREPMLLVGGLLLQATSAEGKSYTDDFVEDFSVPYALYPRTVNIVDGKALVEKEKGVCEWVELSEEGSV